MLKNLMLCFALVFTTSCLMAQTENAKKYKLVVKFGSYASGVPDDAPLIGFINNFKSEHQIKCFCVDKIGPLGREGEYSLAFTLSELNRKQTTLFIEGMKTTVTKMTDNGHATVVLNWELIKSELPQRATIQPIHL